MPRYVLELTAVGFDPHQREVFVRHAVGFGRYSEPFTTYYAHMGPSGFINWGAVATNISADWDVV